MLLFFFTGMFEPCEVRPRERTTIVMMAHQDTVIPGHNGVVAIPMSGGYVQFEDAYNSVKVSRSGRIMLEPDIKHRAIICTAAKITVSRFFER